MLTQEQVDLHNKVRAESREAMKARRDELIAKAEGGNAVEFNDPIVKWLEEAGRPLTRENYLAMAYPEGVPGDWGSELEASLPPSIQIDLTTGNPRALE